MIVNWIINCRFIKIIYKLECHISYIFLVLMKHYVSLMEPESTCDWLLLSQIKSSYNNFIEKKNYLLDAG